MQGTGDVVGRLMAENDDLRGVFGDLDAANARVAELEAENERLGRLYDAREAEVQELLSAQNRIRSLCRDGYFFGHGFAHAVFVADVMSCIPAVDGGTRRSDR